MCNCDNKEFRFFKVFVEGYNEVDVNGVLNYEPYGVIRIPDGFNVIGTVSTKNSEQNLFSFLMERKGMKVTDIGNSLSLQKLLVTGQPRPTKIDWSVEFPIVVWNNFEI